MNLTHLKFNIISDFEFMSIENLTLSAAADLAHFRHFIRRGGFSSLFTYLLWSLPSMLAHLLFCRGNYNIFPDTLYFNKQSQSQVRENQRKLLSDKQIRAIGHLVIGKNKANSNPIKAKTNPIQTQFAERAKMMQSEYLQRIMKNNAAKGYEKQSQNKPNFKRDLTKMGHRESAQLKL